MSEENNKNDIKDFKEDIKKYIETEVNFYDSAQLITKKSENLDKSSNIFLGTIIYLINDFQKFKHDTNFDILKYKVDLVSIENNISDLKKRIKNITEFLKPYARIKDYESLIENVSKFDTKEFVTIEFLNKRVKKIIDEMNLD